MIETMVGTPARFASVLLGVLLAVTPVPPADDATAARRRVKRHATQLDWRAQGTWNGSKWDIQITGTVGSKPRKCRERSIEFYDANQGNRHVGTLSSDSAGAFAGYGSFTQQPDFTAVALKKTFRKRGKKHVCREVVAS